MSNYERVSMNRKDCKEAFKVTYLLRVIYCIISSMQKTVYTGLAYKFVRRYLQMLIKIKENSENKKCYLCWKVH